MGLAYDPHNQEMYVADYGAAKVTVLGTQVPLTFTESGLPSGTSWEVVINGTGYSAVAPTDITVSFVPNSGTEHWGVVTSTDANGVTWVGSPTSGNATIATSPVTVALTFAQGSWVTVQESGLPVSGLHTTVWWTNISGPGCAPCSTQHLSNGYTLLLMNGSYSLQPGAPGSWQEVSTKGLSFTVSAPSPVSITLYFVWATNLSFSETGLPVSVSWSVLAANETNSICGPSGCVANWRNLTLSSTGHNLSFPASGIYQGRSAIPAGINGTKFEYHIIAPAGYVSIPAWGNVTLPDPISVVFCQAANLSCPTNTSNGTNVKHPPPTGNGTNNSGGNGSGGFLSGVTSSVEPVILVIMIIVGVALIIFFLVGTNKGRKELQREVG